MRKVTLNLFPQEKYVEVTQIRQFINVTFAYVDKEYTQIMQDVRCKDFMNVPIWQRKSGKSELIYMWRYNFKDTPYDVDTTRISLRFAKDGDRNNFVNNIKYLNDIEIKYGITPTEVLETQDISIVVVEGDKVWQSNCWKMSMYMMYLRRIAHKNPNEPHENSSDYEFLNYFNNHAPIMAEHNMMTNIHVDCDYMEEEYSGYTAHSSSGPMNFLSTLRYVNKSTSELREDCSRLFSTQQKHMCELVRIPNANFQLKEAA